MRSVIRWIGTSNRSDGDNYKLIRRLALGGAWTRSGSRPVWLRDELRPAARDFPSKTALVYASSIRLEACYATPLSYKNGGKRPRRRVRELQTGR